MYWDKLQLDSPTELPLNIVSSPATSQTKLAKLHTLEKTRLLSAPSTVLYEQIKISHVTARDGGATSRAKFKSMLCICVFVI